MLFSLLFAKNQSKLKFRGLSRVHDMLMLRQTDLHNQLRFVRGLQEAYSLICQFVAMFAQMVVILDSNNRQISNRLTNKLGIVME